MPFDFNLFHQFLEPMVKQNSTSWFRENFVCPMRMHSIDI